MKRLLNTILFSFMSCYFWGQNWLNVGSGPNHACYDLLKFNSNLYAGTKSGVFMWDNVSWTQVGPPFVFGIAWPLTLESYNDTLYEGGNPSSGNSTFTRVFKFNNSVWTPIPGILTGAPAVYSLKKFNNKLVVAGSFSKIDTSDFNNIATWDGENWDTLGSGLNGTIYSTCIHNGDFVAAGTFIGSGADTSIRYVARWNNSIWQPLTTSYSFINGGPKPMLSTNSNLIIGNVWDTIIGPMRGIASWNGTNFTTMGSHLFVDIADLWSFNNEIYCAATLYTLNPHDYNFAVLKWNNGIWQQIGSSFDGGLLTLEDYSGELFVGGSFDNCGGAVVPKSARFSNSTTLEEYKSSVVFEHYPNPAIETINLISLNDQQIEVCNALGQPIRKCHLVEGFNPIYIGDLTQGIYLIRSSLNQNLTPIKFVKN